MNANEEKIEDNDDIDESLDDFVEEAASDDTEEADCSEPTNDDGDCVAEESGNDIAVDEGKRVSRFIDPAYNGLLPISLLAGLIGLILGQIPSVLFTSISDSSIVLDNLYSTGIIDLTSNIFYPLFVVSPLIICFFNFLLKGGRDIRALIVTAAFSLASAYLTILLCQTVTLYSIQSLLGFNSTIFQVLETFIESFVALAYSPIPIPVVASAYVYPLVFTALGVVVAALLYRSPARLRNAECGMQNVECEKWY